MIHLKTMLAPPVIAAMFAVAGQAQSGLVSRGKELTEQVAKCQNCHTQRTATGELDRDAWLQGVKSDPSVYIPDITAGGSLWMVWGEKGMLRFLEKGTSPSGTTPSVHMPAYKLRHDDAEAIVAYLKSLR
ncbi:MAG: c-type cytochrome [Candidatus Korobacteraceae bacterium]